MQPHTTRACLWHPGTPTLPMRPALALTTLLAVCVLAAAAPGAVRGWWVGPASGGRCAAACARGHGHGAGTTPPPSPTPASIGA